MKLNEAQEKQLIEWYNKGDSYSVIAERLGTSKTSVFRIIQSLISKGLISPKEKISEEVINEQKQQILKLYNEGLSCNEIANNLDLPYSIVDSRIVALKRSGDIKKSHHPKTNSDKIDKQYRKITIWHRQGLSRKEMADRLGVSLYVINNRISALRRKGIITSYNKRGQKNITDRITQFEEQALQNGYSKETVDILIRLYIQKGLYKDAVVLLDHYERDNILTFRDSELISEIRAKLQSKILKRNSQQIER